MSLESFVKQYALKMLIDYSFSTNKKWTKICNEIMSASSSKPSLNAPLLTRQDLESWARGDSILGDEKFVHVVEFIKHQGAKGLHEFRNYYVLESPINKIIHTGRSISDFYSNFDGIKGYIPRLDDCEISNDDINDVLYSFSGVHVGNYRDRNICLSIDYIRNEKFFVTHLLLKSGIFHETGDWNFHRVSGYSTYSSEITSHLRGIIAGHVHNLWILPPVGVNPDYVNVLSGEIIIRYLNSLRVDRSTTLTFKLPYVDPLDFRCVLHRSNDVKFTRLIDNFRWMVPV